jgi:hypothetical protein
MIHLEAVLFGCREQWGEHPMCDEVNGIQMVGFILCHETLRRRNDFFRESFLTIVIEHRSANNLLNAMSNFTQDEMRSKVFLNCL